MLRRHPLFNKKGNLGDLGLSEPITADIEDSDSYANKHVCIEKKYVLPAVRMLVKLMLVSRAETDFNRLLLICKVSSVFYISHLISLFFKFPSRLSRKTRS